VDLPHPAIAPWGRISFIDECNSFPNGKFDDQVDQMSQALNRLRGMGDEPPQAPQPPPPGNEYSWMGQRLAVSWDAVRGQFTISRFHGQWCSFRSGSPLVPRPRGGAPQRLSGKTTASGPWTRGPASRMWRLRNSRPFSGLADSPIGSGRVLTVKNGREPSAVSSTSYGFRALGQLNWTVQAYHLCFAASEK
jgi:hypothetical protein